MTFKRHFAIGLVVNVRPDARPAGLDEWDGPNPQGMAIEDVFDSGDGGEQPTFRVNGWFWHPEDLIVA